jgi:hypothetical protein
VAPDIIGIIPHAVRVESGFSLGCDVIGGRQSKTACKSVCQHVVSTPCAPGNNGLAAVEYLGSGMMNTDNSFEIY